jgi:hypothetical protein
LSDRKREQARERQSWKRGRDRADRIEQQAEDEAAKMPRAWRPEFLQLVSSARERTARALIQVEKSALSLGEGAAPAYLRRNYQNTKVSVTRLRDGFVRRKIKLAQLELHRDAEYDDPYDDRLEVEDWSDLQTVAWLLGDPEDSRLAAVQPVVRFFASIVLASVLVGNTPIGFAQAIEMLRFLDEMRVRQFDAL